MLKRSTLTGLAAVLFTLGIVLLVVALFRNADAKGGALIWIALVLLAATIGCWFAAAQADGA
jgi:hypothetical protein